MITNDVEDLNPTVFRTVYAEANIVIINIIFFQNVSSNDLYVMQISSDTYLYVHVDERNNPVGLDIVNNGFYYALANVEFGAEEIKKWYMLCCKKIIELDDKLICDGEDILIRSLDG